MVTLCVVILNTRQSTLSAGLSGDRQLLTKYAERYRENLGRLRTWTGTVTVVMKTVHGMTAEDSITTECSGDFDYNAATGDHRYYLAAIKSTFANGKSRPSNLLVTHAGLLHGGECYELAFITGPKSSRIANMGHAPTEQAGWNQTCFVPRFFYTDEGTDHGDVLDFLVRNFDRPTKNGSVTESGDELIVMQTSADKLVSVKRVHSLTTGGNAIRIETTGKADSWTSHTIVTWEWKLINGVFVPTRATKHQSDTSKERGASEYLVDVKWISQKVNEPLSPDAFTLQSIGLRRGDSIRSNTGESRLFDGADFPDGSTATQSPQAPGTRETWLFVPVVAFGVALVLLLVAVICQRFLK